MFFWKARFGKNKKRPKERTHSHHARLQVSRHFPADTLFNLSPAHLLVLLED